MTDVCNLCGKAATLMCQRCNETYCSTNCQILDWRVHKKVCFQMPILVPINELGINGTTIVSHRSIHNETQRNRTPNDNKTPKTLARNPLKIQAEAPTVDSLLVESKISEVSPNKIHADIDFSLKPKHVPSKVNNHSSKSNHSHVSKGSIRSNAPWRTKYPYPVDDFFDCVVQYIDPDNTGIVWVTELRYEGPLRKLLAEINRNIDVNTDRCSSEEIKVGSLIAAPFENLYYRAEIIEVMPIAKMVVVHLIDYGNVIEVQYKDLRSPIPIMRNLNTYSFRIRYKKPVAVESVLTIRVIGVEANGVVKVEEKVIFPKTTPPGLTIEIFSTSPTASLVKYSNNGQFALFCLKNHQVMEQLQEMNNNLNLDSTSKLLLEKAQNEGEFVVARTLHGWSRALVMSIYRNDYLVYLVDVGRISLVEQILEIPEKYKNIPMQVFIVELGKVLSDGKNFTDCLRNQTEFVFRLQKVNRTHRNNSVPCYLQLPGGTKLAEVESFNYYGNCKDVDFAPSDWIEPLLPGSAVYITGVVSHCEVFISLISTKIYSKIFTSAAEDCEILTASNYENGGIILAKKDKEYFRAKILEEPKNENILVLNIDTGCQLTVSIQTSRKPNMFILSCPYHTKKVELMYLSNVATPYLDNKALAMLQQCQQKGAEFILKFDSNMEKGVELILMSPEQQSLNKQLLPMLFEKKFDSSKDKTKSPSKEEQSNCNKKISQIDSNLASDQKIKKIFTLEDLEIIPISCGDNVPILVLDNSTITKGFISGCDFSNKEYLSKLELEYLPLVSRYCESLNKIGEYCPSVDEICLAVYDEDKDWYRAVCLNQMKDDTYYVMFLDYGNMCRVHKSNIRQITKELMFPTNANMCVFEGLPDEVPKKMCDKFISVTQNDPKIVAKVTKLEQDSYLLKLHCMDKYF